MHISKNKNKLVITFPYKPTLVQVVQELEDRKFDKKNKSWTVPEIHVKHVLDKLIPLGFTATEEVRDMYDQFLKLRARVQRIKKGLFNNSEKEILEALIAPLYKYQQHGAAFLATAKRCLLGDQPGLGKTLQVLTAIHIKKLKTNLIICPASLKQTWYEEIEKWYPDKKAIIISGTKKQRLEKWNEKADFYIMNYELLLRDLQEIKKIPFNSITADEATKISNPKAKTTLALKKLDAEYKFALSGTPLNNSIQDIWSILDFCEPGILGSYWQFTERYCEKDFANYNVIIGYKNLIELKSKIQYIMLRRLKADVLHELPPKTFENIYIEFSSAERKMYNSIKNELHEELKEMKSRRGLANILTRMVRLKQLTGSSELVFKNDFISSKTDALRDILTLSFDNDNKAIVFTQFRQMAILLMRDLKCHNPVLIAGGMSDEDKTENEKLFMTDDKHKLLIMTDAGAFGLNLQKAATVIHYDLPWSISKVEQREDRAHRMGQTENVTIYKLIVEESIDEYVVKVLHKKQIIANEVLGDSDTLKKVKISRRDINNMLK